MKKIANNLDWYPHSEWSWPERDKKLVQVLDWVADIHYIMDFVANPRVCVQAGGACGVWPYRFAQFFDAVYTFEPQPDNWECLIENIHGKENIFPFNRPLADVRDKFIIHNDIHERENWGAGYCVEDEQGIRSCLIDDLGLVDCDLIQLDIEGFELRALQGAVKTIQLFWPVIVLEEKRLNHMKTGYDEPRKWLEKHFGYKQVGSIHKDVILRRD